MIDLQINGKKEKNKIEKKESGSFPTAPAPHREKNQIEKIESGSFPTAPVPHTLVSRSGGMNIADFGDISENSDTLSVQYICVIFLGE